MASLSPRRLEFSRSNVSMGLKELQAWRLVRLRHRPGDRREIELRDTIKLVPGGRG